MGLRVLRVKFPGACSHQMLFCQGSLPLSGAPEPGSSCGGYQMYCATTHGHTAGVWSSCGIGGC